MDETLLEAAKRYIREKGKRVNYGCGHVVYELEYNGKLIELEASGMGDKIWIDKSHVEGTY